MGENPDHDREEVPGRPAVSSENTREQAQEGREQQAEEGKGGSDHEVAPVLPAAFPAPVNGRGAGAVGW